MNDHQIPGPSVVQGKLFFRLLDGSSISCECIGEPYASKIVELYREMSDALAIANADR